MQELIDLAENLGKKIAAHERTLHLQQAQKAIRDDPDALKLIEAYQNQAKHIQQLEQENKPIEPEDKRKLRELEENISTNDALRELSRRQADFVEMMHKVKETIDRQLTSAVENL